MAVVTMVSHFNDRMSRIHDLELVRQRRLHQTELIKRDEDARKLKLRTLTLRDENANLKENVSQKDHYYRQWIKQREQLRAELDEARDIIRNNETRAKKQALEMTNLKAEIDSLATTAQDSGKALQEKFALTRELNRLRPELEHLQSQLTNHQAVIAEKHDLRRQVDTLEVELENERRARQRTKSKHDEGDFEEIRSQLQDTEKKLSASKKEKERLKREHEKALAGLTERCEQLEDSQREGEANLKQAQSELKETKSQLKSLQKEFEDCRAELEETRTSVAATTTTHSVSVPTKAEAPAKATGAKPRRPAKAATKPARKRRIEEIGLDEASIGTPGNESMTSKPAKKRGIEHVVAAEKSTFSITPFLNRNKGLDDVTLEETPVASRESSGESHEDSMGEPEIQANPSPKKVTAAKAQKPRGRPPKAQTAMAETTASKRNVVASQKPAKTNTTANSVPEDDNDERENMTSPKKRATQSQSAKPPISPKGDTSKAQVQPDGKTTAVEGEKKKKRKFLGAGTTLFDEEDGEPTRPLAGAAVRRIKAPLGGGSNGFGAFSPLKRHKRGVGASFLA